MSALLEVRASQNPALGAVLLWQFCSSYEEQSQKLVSWPITFLVLPILYNTETLRSINARQLNSGLYRVLAEDRGFSAGLQPRTVGLADITFASLNLACAAELLTVERGEDVYVRTHTKRLPKLSALCDLKDMLDGAKRLGRWYQQVRLDVLCSLLNVRF